MNGLVNYGVPIPGANSGCFVLFAIARRFSPSPTEREEVEKHTREISSNSSVRYGDDIQASPASP